MLEAGHLIPAIAAALDLQESPSTAPDALMRGVRATAQTQVAQDSGSIAYNCLSRVPAIGRQCEYLGCVDS